MVEESLEAQLLKLFAEVRKKGDEPHGYFERQVDKTEAPNRCDPRCLDKVAHFAFGADPFDFAKVWGDRVAAHLWGKFVSVYDRDFMKLYASLDKENAQKLMDYIVTKVTPLHGD
jgi:hypothetical protein